MRLRRFDAQSLALVFLVFAVVPVEPEDLRIALESEDVRSHAIEEPAIVRDDDRASGEILQRFLQRRQGVDVEIVRRLVEQQNVGGSRNEKPRLAPGLSS